MENVTDGKPSGSRDPDRRHDCVRPTENRISAMHRVAHRQHGKPAPDFERLDYSILSMERSVLTAGALGGFRKHGRAPVMM
jgi:hypothetical protein